ncbi:MAG: CoA-transferase, partial [Promethearchaeota archaeon]
MTASSKITSLANLIEQNITVGSHIYLEGILANRLPMAAIHEIIRAQVKKLRIVSAPGSIGVDQLIGAGSVSDLEFYFLGVMTKTGFATMRRFREAAERGTIRVKESMGYAICM